MSDGPCVCRRGLLGTPFFSIDASGNLTFNRTSVGLQQLLSFTTPGTFTFTKASFPGLTRIRVRAVGGGGGAAGANPDTGEAVARAGAGGGGYSESVLNASALGATETITVGLGGLGGIGDDDGNNGGDSSFGGFVVARGGGASTRTMPSGTGDFVVSGGSAGVVGIGQIAVPGEQGHGAIRMGAIPPTVTINNQGGGGGSSGGGLGAGGRDLSSDTGGSNGAGFGGGGGGATSRNGAARNGGNGSGGAVFLELYF